VIAEMTAESLKKKEKGEKKKKKEEGKLFKFFRAI
jgi:hypothetical protein